jgi:alpha-1,3-rhamnosyl/mannosyltransferase
LPERYALYVGRCAPHKNVAVLLRTWNTLPAAVAAACPLVLAGGDVDGFRALAAGRETGAVLPGFVPDDDLPGLYAGATLMCFPSLYEGFGLPPLEAMACGTAVIAARAASLPEVLGDAARLVDPRDEGAWAESVQELLSNRQQRATLAAAGAARARSFTPERSGSALLRCLIEAATGPEAA